MKLSGKIVARQSAEIVQRAAGTLPKGKELENICLLDQGVSETFGFT